MFEVGQKVVCIADGWCNFWDEITPIKGQVYTVRECLVSGGMPCIRLVEIRNPPFLYRDAIGECGFDSQCFRPLVSEEDAAKRTVARHFGHYLKTPEKELTPDG